MKLLFQFACRFIMASMTVCLLNVARADDARQPEMWEEPSHQLVFEDGPVRVLDVRIAPGVTSEFHLHRFATVYVVVQDALVAGQAYGEEWAGGGARDYRRPGGLIERSDYVTQNLYHRVRNDDDRAFHLFAVVSAYKGDDVQPETDSTMWLNNPWFREHRLTVRAGSESESQFFDNDVVLLQPVAGQSHVIENGVAHSFKNVSGAFSWHQAATEFQISNQSKTDQEFVLIEVRR